MELVVGGLFAEEIDGGGAGDLGLGGHRELFGGGRGPLLGVSGDGGENGQAREKGREKREAEETTA